MKVIIVHPPMYPVNHEFYNILAKKVELIVYQICEHPIHHTSWTSKEIRQQRTQYKFKIFSHGAVTTKKTLNPSFLLDVIKEHPDIVLSIAFWVPSLYLSLLKTVFNFKLLILTNAIPQTELHLSYSKKMIRKFMGKNVDTFISASDLTTQYLNSIFPQKKIILSLQTINVRKWQNTLELLDTKENLRKKLNIAIDKKVMLGIGNYTEKKNWKSVLKLLPKINDILFILVGHGEQKNEYLQMIKELKISEKVNILERKDGNELLEYYKLSDFLIFPSLYDQFGFVVPEALASGLPVICTQNAGSVSLITEKINGMIIDPVNYNEEVITSMLKEFPKLKKNSYKDIKNATLENRVNEFVKIFKKSLI